MSDSSRIAIAGGGIAGLTLALALARRGTPSALIEQAPRLEELGAGLQVSPNAWHVLARLGLEDELSAASLAPRAVRIRSAQSNATVAVMPLGGRAAARWGAPYGVIHRADLQAMLARAVEATGLCDVTLGVRACGLRRDAAGVELAFADAPSRAFAGLVGADGLWSTVRRACFGEGEPRYSGKVAWRASIPAEAMPGGLDRDETGLWLGRDAHLVHYGVREGSEINIVAVVAGSWRESGWSAAGDSAGIVGRFDDWPEPARALVAAPAMWGCWALADRPALPRWGDGPVTLVGDAAHPMLPFLAQGAAMGMEDAWVLAEEIAAADGLAPAFRRYERRRVERTSRAQRAARANGDIYHLGGLAAAARDAGMRVLGPDRLMARMDWLYGWRP